MAGVDTTLRNGEQDTFTVAAANCRVGTTLLSALGSSKFSAAFGVKYTNDDSKLPHVVNGTIITRVE